MRSVLVSASCTGSYPAGFLLDQDRSIPFSHVVDLGDAAEAAEASPLSIGFLELDISRAQ
jgi:hypothetical protein